MMTNRPRAASIPPIKRGAVAPVGDRHDAAPLRLARSSREPSVLPLSATTTSPAMPALSIAASALRMQVASVSASFRHGITTVSSMSFCAVSCRGSTNPSWSPLVTAVGTWYACSPTRRPLRACCKVVCEIRILVVAIGRSSTFAGRTPRQSQRSKGFASWVAGGRDPSAGGWSSSNDGRAFRSGRRRRACGQNFTRMPKVIGMVHRADLSFVLSRPVPCSASIFDRPLL